MAEIYNNNQYLSAIASPVVIKNTTGDFAFCDDFRSLPKKKKYKEKSRRLLASAFSWKEKK